MIDPSSSRFIGEPIAVEFDEPPLFRKRPHCPDRMTWRGETFALIEVVAQWVRFDRRGRAGDNMRPLDLLRATQRGSWGVGRYFFRARFRLAAAEPDGPVLFEGRFGLPEERLFELYYDRAPRDVDDRLGAWFLRRELLPGAAAG